MRLIPHNRTHFSTIINDIIIDMNKFEFLPTARHTTARHETCLGETCLCSVEMFEE